MRSRRTATCSCSARTWARRGARSRRPAGGLSAYGLLRAAVEDPDPVLYFEHKGLFNVKGELGEAPARVELGRAEVVRAGEHVTVVATQMMRHRALEAAETLSGEGVAVEVIDPRTLVPLDLETIGASIDRTNLLAVVQEAPPGGSWGASLIAALMQERFEMLDAPPLLIATDETPVPYAGPLEAAYLPSVDRIVDGIRRTLEY